jgi:hypothetical protein
MKHAASKHGEEYQDQSYRPPAAKCGGHDGDDAEALFVHSVWLLLLVAVLLATFEKPRMGSQGPSEAQLSTVGSTLVWLHVGTRQPMAAPFSARHSHAGLHSSVTKQ